MYKALISFLAFKRSQRLNPLRKMSCSWITMWEWSSADVLLVLVRRTTLLVFDWKLYDTHVSCFVLIGRSFRPNQVFKNASDKVKSRVHVLTNTVGPPAARFVFAQTVFHLLNKSYFISGKRFQEDFWCYTTWSKDFSAWIWHRSYWTFHNDSLKMQAISICQKLYYIERITLKSTLILFRLRNDECLWQNRGENRSISALSRRWCPTQCFTRLPLPLCNSSDRNTALVVKDK